MPSEEKSEAFATVVLKAWMLIRNHIEENDPRMSASTRQNLRMAHDTLNILQWSIVKDMEESGD